MLFRFRDFFMLSISGNFYSECVKHWTSATTMTQDTSQYLTIFTHYVAFTW